MRNRLFLVICGLSAFFTVLTAGSAYLSGASIKTLLIRAVTSALLVGSIGLIIYLWLQNRNYLIEQPSVTKVVGQNVDIEVDEQAPPPEDWKPLQVTEIAADDTSRVFPVRK